jgi:hypothetical protein
MNEPLSPAGSTVCQNADGSWQYQPLHGQPRRDSAAVAHELAAILRDRHGGSSQVADGLDGVGCHTPGARQAVQEGI